MTRRVAVTGIGVIAAPGSTRAAFWESLRNGRSAIRPMKLVPEGALRFPNAAEVPDYRASDYMDEKEADLLDRFAQPVESHMPCHEYCGTGHEGMWANVHVIDKTEFLTLARQQKRVSCVAK